MRILSEKSLRLMSVFVLNGVYIFSPGLVFFLLELILETANSQFKKLVLPLSVHDLLLKEVFLLFIALSLDLPVPDGLIEFLLLSFLPDLVLSDGGNGILELGDLLVLERVIGVLLI